VRREGISRLTGAVYLFNEFEIGFQIHNEKLFSSFSKANKFAFSGAKQKIPFGIFFVRCNRER
jgi:hypothetical protein